MGLLPDRVLQQILKEAERMAGSPNYNPRPSLEQPCLYCGEQLKRGHQINEASQIMTCPDGSRVDLTVPPPARPVRAKSIPAGPGPTTPSLASQSSPLGVRRLPRFYNPTASSPVNPVQPQSQPPVYLQGICPVCLHDWDSHEEWDGKVCYDCPGERCGAVTPMPPPDPEPELTPLGGVGINITASPELDKFLVAMLRSVGGTLTIYPADAELLEGERLCVNHLANPDRVVYELKSEEDDDERHVRDSDTG